MTIETLHVVVSCKSRKTVVAPANLHMSTVDSVGLRERAGDWVKRLQTHNSVGIPARSLYAGDHWKVVLRIPESAAGRLNVRLWVASAGYGLVSIDTPLKSYSATFIVTHPESVAPRGCGYLTPDWWCAISTWRPGGYTGPRSVYELAASLKHKDDRILLALSKPYALALSEDIASAERTVPGRIAMVSVGLAAKPGSSTARGVLPVEARLKQIVGGAMQGVNGRIAEKIVREHERWFPDMDKLRALVSQWVNDSPLLPTYHRAGQSNEAIREFIREHSDHIRSHTRMLRAFRDSGRACEQTRFRRLYDEVLMVSRPRQGADLSLNPVSDAA